MKIIDKSRSMNMITWAKLNFTQFAPILFLIILFFSINGFSQPGRIGGSLSFRVFKEGKLIKLPNKNWQILPQNITLSMGDSISFSSHFYIDRNTDFYDIIPMPTNGGGMVNGIFFIDLICKHDTMRIYPPSIQYNNIVLDSIPFKKGTYKIPQSVYDLKEVSKRDYDKQTVPNLYGNWDSFIGEQYKCYIQKMDDISWESLYGKNYYAGKSDWRNWQNLYILDTNMSYYFYENIIVKYVYGSREITIYEVKDDSDINNWIHVSTLFYKHNTVFAIINKGNRIRGIYKLRFTDKI